MNGAKRILSYDLAIQEAFCQLMESDPRVFILGQGVKSPWYVGNTTKGLFQRFGPTRVIDTPVSENTMTGAATGAAICGMRPIVIHPRMDFMVYATDQIVNEAANWHAMFGGQSQAPVVIRAIINRGGEQGAQHSQALQAWFAHVPGLIVVMPATPYDAKGLLISAVRHGHPVLYIDDRWLYKEAGEVPEEMYEVPIGKGTVHRAGQDVTIVAISYMVKVAQEAARLLEKDGIHAEIIDVRSVKPLDDDIIFQSVKKTGRLVIAEAAWKTGGVSGEIAARAAESVFSYLKAPILRVALLDIPAPTSRTLEQAYYENISVTRLTETVRSMTSKKIFDNLPSYENGALRKSPKTVSRFKTRVTENRG